ncbi:MAG: dapH 2, partial [Sporomusa sp.]|nr:dapH 2 [Sporomusa sp.]
MDFKKVASSIGKTRNLYLQARIWLYDLLSDGEVIGEPNIIHPCIFTGAGKVAFGQNVTLGVWPSPCYWSGNSHFDTRSSEARIEIGNNVAINNNFT